MSAEISTRDRDKLMEIVKADAAFLSEQGFCRVLGHTYSGPLQPGVPELAFQKVHSRRECGWVGGGKWAVRDGGMGREVRRWERAQPTNKLESLGLNLATQLADIMFVLRTCTSSFILLVFSLLEQTQNIACQQTTDMCVSK